MGASNPFSGMTGTPEPAGPQGPAPASFDSANMAGPDPTGTGGQSVGGQPQVDEIVRKTMSELDGYVKGIESLSRRFPGAAKNLRAASEALNRALKDVIQQMRSEETAPKVAV